MNGIKRRDRQWRLLTNFRIEKMDYAKHYQKLIDRAVNRELIGYCEKHHIRPRCFGKPYSMIVRLTPEEHYLAHQLLVKMWPGNVKLVWAASNMTGATSKMKRNNKLYGWLRRKLASALKNRIFTEDTRRKMSDFAKTRVGINNPNFGKHRSEETKLRISLGNKGKKKSPQHCAAMSKAQMGVKRGSRSQEFKNRVSKLIKIAKNKKGRDSFFDDPSYCLKQSERMKQIWEERRTGVLLMPQRKMFQ